MFSNITYLWTKKSIYHFNQIKQKEFIEDFNLLICPLNPFDASVKLLIVVVHGLLDGLEVGLVEAICDSVGNLALGPSKPCRAQSISEEVVIRNRVTNLHLCRVNLV